MAKTDNEYRRKLSSKDTTEVLPIDFETVPPQKESTKATKPKINVELWKEGDDFISIKLENNRETERA